MKPSAREERFKALLDEHHVWPVDFTFKFVVPADSVDHLERALVDERREGEWTTRASSGGKYISVTLGLEMTSAEAVLLVYGKAFEVPGLIAL